MKEKILLFTCLLALLAGCSKKDNTTFEEMLSVAPLVINADYMGGDYSVAITKEYALMDGMYQLLLS